MQMGGRLVAQAFALPPASTKTGRSHRVAAAAAHERI